MKRSRLRTLTVAMILSVLPLLAEAQSSYERVLFPVAIDTTPGGEGSIWKSEIWFYNSSAGTINVFIPRSCSDPFCHPERILFPRGEVVSAGDLRVRLRQPSSGQAPDLVIYVPASLADSLHMRLFVRELSREAEAAGTEIPIVRERQFTSKKIELLAIPNESRFRTLLRVYVLDPVPPGGNQVLVRIYDSSGPITPLAETVLVLQGPGPERVGPFPTQATYGQLSIDSLLPANSTARNLRVEIVPISPALRYWAFASIVDNVSQHFTTVTP